MLIDSYNKYFYIICIIKNISFSTSHKKTPGLCDTKTPVITVKNKSTLYCQINRI